MKDWQKISQAARSEMAAFPTAEEGHQSDRIRIAEAFFYRVRGVAPNGKKLQVVHEDEFTASKLFALGLAENGGPPVLPGQFSGNWD